MVQQRAFAAFLHWAEIHYSQNLLVGFPRELELHRDCREIGATYSAEQANMGADKKAALNRKPIVLMTESKGSSDMKKPRYFITMTSEGTLIRMKNRLLSQRRFPDCVSCRWTGCQDCLRIILQQHIDRAALFWLQSRRLQFYLSWFCWKMVWFDIPQIIIIPLMKPTSIDFNEYWSFL